MILGVGIDVIAESDFKQRVKRSPNLLALISRFARSAVHDSSEPILDIGNRSASLQRAMSDLVALEALMKALPSELRSELKSLRILRDSFGKPYIENPIENERIPEGIAFHLSISHQAGITIGVVIIESQAKVSS